MYVLYKCVKCYVIQSITGMFCTNMSSILSFSVQHVCSAQICQVFCHSVYKRYVLYKCVKCFVIQGITCMVCINVSSVLSFSVL